MGWDGEGKDHPFPKTGCQAAGTAFLKAQRRDGAGRLENKTGKNGLAAD